MTTAELRFYESVPNSLRDIALELRELENIKKELAELKMEIAKLKED